MITQDELKELLHYEPETGVFTWKKSRGSVRVGNVAGVLDIAKGYIKIWIHGKSYLAHRLAFLYIYGKFDKAQIDHVNGVKTDNRIENLRESSHSENQQNRHKASTNNKCGYLGVSFCKQKNKFRAFISINNKNTHIGVFETADEAHQAYLNKKREVHEFCTL